MLYNGFMGKITSIESQAKGDRLNIFVDGEFKLGVCYEVAFAKGLREGKFLTDEDIAELKAEDQSKKAFDCALKYAVKKTVSKKQLSDYLVRKGFTIDEATAAIKKAEQYGYADDLKYAKAYVSTYGAVRGKIRLENELKRAGINSDDIAAAMELSSANACADAVAKYMRTHKQVDRKKLYGYLCYRGFDYDEINDALRSVFNED